jgi:hypothetical protein
MPVATGSEAYVDELGEVFIDRSLLFAGSQEHPCQEGKEYAVFLHKSGIIVINIC